MKQLFILAFLLLSSNAFAKSYCREVRTGGFGAPPGIRFHCVTLVDKKMLVDNASTFFGDPPENLKYRIVKNGTVIEVLKKNKWQFAYTIAHNGTTLTNDAGSVLVQTKLTSSKK